MKKVLIILGVIVVCMLVFTQTAVDQTLTSTPIISEKANDTLLITPNDLPTDTLQ